MDSQPEKNMQSDLRRKKMATALAFLVDESTRIREGASTPLLPGHSDARIRHFYIDDEYTSPVRTVNDVRRSTEQLIIKTQMFLSRTRLEIPKHARLDTITSNTPIVSIPFMPRKPVAVSPVITAQLWNEDEQYFDAFESKWQLETKKWVL